MDIEKIQTTQDLTTLLKRQFEKDEVSDEMVKYVIYLRKSTEEDTKQKHSIEDQKKACLELVRKQNLILVDIIREERSAKESGKRPGFQKMIDGVRAGKYDGIIAWHPNRLARNMKDAGEIIDLVDKGVIKALKFSTFQFENSAMGKMTLGLTFVLSKTYSDNLSDSVNRGNKGRLNEGKYINKAKHGYHKDRNGRLRPDGRNFELIQDAFRMRLEGKTNVAIAEYLNENNYTRTNSQTGKTYGGAMDKKRVGNIMKDPVYAGVVVYGKRVVDLTKLYNFMPAITVSEFMKINKLNKQSQVFKLAQAKKQSIAIKADLLRGCVLCSNCGEPKSAGITSKKNKKTGKKTRYFYFRCENDSCDIKSKSTRAKVVIDFVKEFVKSKDFASERAYKSCQKEMRRISKADSQALQNKLTGKNREKETITNNLRIIKQNIALETKQEMRDIQESEMNHAMKRIAEIDSEIQYIEDQIQKTKRAPLTYEKFLELLDKLIATLHNTTDMKELDFHIQKIFSNFSVNQKNVVSYTLKAPFKELLGVKTGKVSNGGDYNTYLELFSISRDHMELIEKWESELQKLVIQNKRRENIQNLKY